MAVAGFADGSLLLRLDRLRDEALLPHIIAAALRLPGPGGAGPGGVTAGAAGVGTAGLTNR